MCNHYNSVDSKQFPDIKTIDKSLAIIGLTQKERLQIYEVLAAILHMGNVTFKKNPITDVLEISNETEHHFEYASQLLHVEPKTLKKTLLARDIEVDGLDKIM